MDVFISYRNIPDERAFAQELHAFVKNECGYNNTFFDRVSIRPGFDYVDELDSALDQADVIVGVMSPEAIRRPNVTTEWDRALDKPPGRLLLLRIKPCSLEKHPDFGRIQYIDVVGQSKAAAFERLRNCLKDVEKELANAGTRVVSKGQRIRPADERAIMRKVQRQWIDSVLKKAIEETAKSDDFVVPQPKLILRDSEHGSGSGIELSEHQTIGDAFRHSGEMLLILGEPGAGKTTELLKLADILLEKAKHDGDARIPVVLNLSSWVLAYNVAQHREGVTSPTQAVVPDFIKWVEDELKVNYQISRAASKRFIEGRQFVLLLDGLDEVRADLREALVDSINRFMEYESGAGASLAICSRINEYNALASHLNNPYAIEVRRLSRDQVCDALNNHPHLTSLAKAVSSDDSLMQLASIPLFLSLLVKTYRDDGELIDTLQNKPPDQRGTILLERYLKTRFRRPGDYTYAISRQYLSYLSHWMKQRSLSIFLLEQMQAHMLPAGQKRLYFILTRVLGLVLFGLPFAALGGLLLERHYDSLAWTVAAPVLAVSVGIIFMTTIERFLSARMRAFLVGTAVTPAALVIQYAVIPPLSIIIAVGAGLLIGTLAWWALRRNIGSMNEDDRDIYPVETIHWSITKGGQSVAALMMGALLAIGVMWLLLGRSTLLMIVPICFIVNGLSGGIVGEPDRVGQIRRPGGGIVRSFGNGLLILVVFSAISIGLATLFGTQVFGFPAEDTIPVAIAGGIAASLPVALFYGLFDGVKYLILRGIQTLSKSTPPNLFAFLTFAEDHQLMRQTGRGFLLIHRFLLEYLAERYRPVQN